MAKAMVPGSEEERELTRLMETYGGMLVSLCATALRDSHLAQDATQETFLKAYRHLSQLARADSERAWLIRIALNTCRDYQRTWWARHVDRRVPLELLPEAGAEDASRDILDQVRRLPRGEREAVLLHYWQGMDADEIAAALGVNRATVYRKLNKARARLRLEMEGGEEP